MPEREHEPIMPDEDDNEVGPKEGEGVDENPGVTPERFERVHQDDAAKEEAEEKYDHPLNR